MKESKLFLKENPTLSDLQAYVVQMVEERGFEKEKVADILILFFEECGELARAIRKLSGLKSDKNSVQANLEHEAADILVYLLDICNLTGVDLEKAFREKEEINKKRTWE